MAEEVTRYGTSKQASTSTGRALKYSLVVCPFFQSRRRCLVDDVLLKYNGLSEEVGLFQNWRQSRTKSQDPSTGTVSFAGCHSTTKSEGPLLLPCTRDTRSQVRECQYPLSRPAQLEALIGRRLLHGTGTDQMDVPTANTQCSVHGTPRRHGISCITRGTWGWFRVASHMTDTTGTLITGSSPRNREPDAHSTADANLA